MALKLDLKVGESLVLDGGNVVIKLIEKSGQRVRLEVQAPPEVSIKHQKSLSSAAMAANGLSAKAA